MNSLINSFWPEQGTEVGQFCSAVNLKQNTAMVILDFEKHRLPLSLLRGNEMECNLTICLFSK